MYHLQDDDNQDVMSVVEKYKRVYFSYQSLYQSNADYLQYFKSHIKLVKTRNGAVGSIVTTTKHNITGDTSNEDPNTESTIK